VIRSTSSQPVLNAARNSHFVKSLVFLIFSAATLTGFAIAEAPKTAKPPAFQLTLTASEGFIKKGKLGFEIIKKRFALDASAVARSKKFGKLSSNLAPKLEGIFKTLTREGKDARFNLEKGSWVARQRSAWKVNEEQTRKNLFEAIKAGRNTAEVALEVTPPRRNVQNWADSGITTLFGKGSSSFKGSPSFRVRNIIVGASKLDNDYLKDGAELDFNGSVGAINKATGFVEGFVIIGGTLEKEDGGGICQVSTTLFRAAYNAGLPVTERHEHSHRVTYYDPVGFEATVYAPTKNLKFKNDSGGTLLIQAEWDEKAQTLGFYLFGRTPDRQVTVSKPSISNFKPAAKPSYTADPKIRLGASRRIDVPEQGMTAVINRRVVMKDGKVRKDSTKSVYQPWGAVYAVNPKDSRLGQ
jgi:vancomycin resistance protein YoaR